MSARTDLVFYLQNTFRTHNVYGSPPGKIELPAIVIAPDAPYLTPVSFCLYEWGLQIAFFVGRTADNVDLDTLDEWIPEAWRALEEYPTGNVTQVRSVDAVEINGTPYVAAVFTMRVKGSLDNA